MKRVIYFVIIVYLIVGALILIFLEEKSDKINYFTIDMDYSRMMSSEETLSFSLFIDNNQNFLIDKNNITSVALSNAEMEISVSLLDLFEAENNIEYQNKLYYQFIIEVGFDEVSLAGLDLAIEEAFLNINYINGEMLKVSIGDLYLTFKEIEIDNYLDYVSLSCLTEIVEEQEYVGGVVIKFNNLTNQDIEIIDVTSNNRKIGFSIKNYYFNEEKPTGFVSQIIENYLDMELEKETFVLNENGYYVIPIVYLDGFEKIFRFPITIEYQYNNSVYELCIDDYLFLNEMVNFDEYVGNINTYIYQYQESD
ncbi:MAG TPA: hypothetical protein PLB83_02675 [Bacillota bacterium]|nr:hypothetical protein [Bacillota bacterium]